MNAMEDLVNMLRCDERERENEMNRKKTFSRIANRLGNRFLQKI